MELLPEPVGRVMDLGTGDGRLLDLVLTARPGSSGVGLDLNAEMLARARARFFDVDCHWKRRELALLVGVHPDASG